LKGEILNYAISEHIENAGVHSGDATLLLPAQKLYVETVKRIKNVAAKIAKSLQISGPFNIQLLSKNNDLSVIECNLRASRSLPFVSKTFNVNFVDLATKVMVGAPVKARQIKLDDVDFVCMKVPLFSFTRLAGADPILRVEMASTGEVACFAATIYEAYLKGLIAANFVMPKSTVFLSAGSLHAKLELLPAAQVLRQLGYTLYASQGTAHFLQERKIDVSVLEKASTKAEPNIISYLKSGKIDLVINIPRGDQQSETDGYYIRRTSVDFSVPLISNIKSAMLFVNSLAYMKGKQYEILSWDEYMRQNKLL